MWAPKGPVCTQSVAFGPLFFTHRKQNELAVNFSHWPTDEQLEKSELKPRLAKLSNKNVTVPVCCST